MTVIASRKAACEINKANGHSKSLKYRTTIAIPQMAVIDIIQVPEAAVHAIAAVALDSKRMAVPIIVILAIVAVRSAVNWRNVAAMKHPRPGAKHSANKGKAKNSNKG